MYSFSGLVNSGHRLVMACWLQADLANGTDPRRPGRASAADGQGALARPPEEAEEVRASRE